MAILPRAPGVIDAARIARQIAAAVDSHQLQIREACQSPRKDQVVKRECRIQRIAKHIVEIEMGQAFAVGESIRMHHDECAERLSLGEERSEFRIR